MPHRFPSFIGGYLGYSEYLAAVNRAKDRDQRRWARPGTDPHYEILSCPGTMLVRERISVITPHPLIDRVHCAMFDGRDHDEVVRVIRHHLDREDERQRVAAAGNAFLREHYTPRPRARQLLAEALL
jgi:hypothetical protein